jgi:hypothetical protein
LYLSLNFKRLSAEELRLYPQLKHLLYKHADVVAEDFKQDFINLRCPALAS